MRNQNGLELLNETLSFSISNISNELEIEIGDLRETIIKKVGLQLANEIHNMTDKLNALKQKQNELIDLVDDNESSVDIMSTFLVGKYATYAESIRNNSLLDLVGISSNVQRNSSQYNQNSTNLIDDALSLKLQPIDDNLKKV